MRNSVKANDILRHSALEQALGSMPPAAARVIYDMAAAAAGELAEKEHGPSTKILVAALLDIAGSNAALRISEDDAFALYAFRYSIGRMTYITGFCVEMLLSRWTLLTASMQQQIQDEIRKAIADGRAGMECDISEWGRLLPPPEVGGEMTAIVRPIG
jgi:hypothetical protein